jgi:hypothetical protein
MTCLKKLISLNNCKLTMINFVVYFCGVVVGAGNLCCNWVKFFIVLHRIGVQFPCTLLCFGFCLCYFCVVQLACNLLINQIWKFCIHNLCAYPPCFKN